jgi:hypothetical protein
VVDIFAKSLGTKKLWKFKDIFGALELDFSLQGSVKISSSTNNTPG